MLGAARRLTTCRLQPHALQPHCRRPPARHVASPPPSLPLCPARPFLPVRGKRNAGEAAREHTARPPRPRLAACPGPSRDSSLSMLARISSVLARPALLVRARPAAEAVVAEGWRSFATAAPAALPRTRRAPEGRPLKLPEDLRPTLVDGKWRRPRVSHRRAAELRKAAILDGSFGAYDAATGASPLLSPARASARPLPVGAGVAVGASNARGVARRCEGDARGREERGDRLESLTSSPSSWPGPRAQGGAGTRAGTRRVARR